MPEEQNAEEVVADRPTGARGIRRGRGEHRDLDRTRFLIDNEWVESRGTDTHRLGRELGSEGLNAYFKYKSIYASSALLEG